MKEGHYVLLAGESPSLEVLKLTFPQLEWVNLPGFKVQLSHNKRQWLKLLLQTPSLLASIAREHRATQTIIKDYNIDLIISDNRYGVRSPHIASVIITHQTTPYLGKTFYFLRPLSNLISKRWLQQFDECWVPDIEGNLNLSGTLSQPISKLKIRHIGFLSRLALVNQVSSDTCDVLVILSGPEPQRSILKKLLIQKLKDSKLKTILISGKIDEIPQKIGSIQILPHCYAEELKSLIMNSRHIICRSGYSTLMDLAHCRRSALLIPTPGQYEQEYLANRAVSLWGFRSINQHLIENTPLQHLLFEQMSPFEFNIKSCLQLGPLP